MSSASATDYPGACRRTLAAFKRSRWVLPWSWAGGLGTPFPTPTSHSLGVRNWVLTRNAEWTAQGAFRASSLDEVIGRITGPDLWVAGGGVVYSLALPLAQECFVTEIDAEFPGDSWGPELRFPWRRNESHHAASGWQVSGTNGVRFRYSVFVRDGS